jgi:hypothetical protein
LRQERQQLLQRLLEANEQISDLHDELGPALLRGSPTRTRPSSAAARASAARVSWQLPGGGSDAGGWGGSANGSQSGEGPVGDGWTDRSQQKNMMRNLCVPSTTAVCVAAMACSWVPACQPPAIVTD